MDFAANVSRPEAIAEQSSDEQLALFVRVFNRDYRAAVAQMIKEIKADSGKTNELLAEDGHCSETTIANGENGNGNMDPVILLNIVGNNGGQQRLKRILTLVNGAPIEQPTADTRLNRIEREINALRKEMGA